MHAVLAFFRMNRFRYSVDSIVSTQTNKYTLQTNEWEFIEVGISSWKKDNTTQSFISNDDNDDDDSTHGCWRDWFCRKDKHRSCCRFCFSKIEMEKKKGRRKTERKPHRRLIPHHGTHTIVGRSFFLSLIFLLLSHRRLFISFYVFLIVLPLQTIPSKFHCWTTSDAFKHWQKHKQR